MIKKILSLENVGKFINFRQDKDFVCSTKKESTNCNIIFGFNGAGKSTISNVLSLFGKASFVPNKLEILDQITRTNGENTSIKVDFITGKPQFYPATKDLPIYVFNSNFISNHVADTIKPFGNSETSINSPELESINSQIKTLTKWRDSYSATKDSLSANFKQIKESISREFNTKAPAGGRMFATVLEQPCRTDKSEQQIIQTISKLWKDYEVSNKQDKLFSDIEKIKKLQFVEFDIDCLQINELLKKTVSSLSKDVLETRIKNIQNLFTDDNMKQSVEKWFRYGKSILDRKVIKRCPICDNDISDKLDAILKIFNDYFSQEYETLTNSLNDCVIKISNFRNNLNENIKNLDVFVSLTANYGDKLNSSESTNLNVVDISVALKDIIDIIHNKLVNLQQTNIISDVVLDKIKDFNNSIKQIQRAKAKVVEILETGMRAPKEIEQDLKEQYRFLVFLRFDASHADGAIKTYNDTILRLNTINTTDVNDDKGLLFWTNKRNEELKKLRIESKYINDFLNKLGVNSFTIDLKDKPGEENKEIVVRYTATISEKKKRTLSDGEKTALAFAYFMSKMKSEVSDTELKDSCIVIDDPISSLDENRLYSTALVIKYNFSAAKQLIVLSHNFMFLKFFNSVCSGRAQHLFIQDDAIVDLPEELENFETTYFYMLKDMWQYSKGEIEHTVARKYLPNFVRRVLDVFFSFKFAVLWSQSKTEQSADNKKKSPSLGDHKKLLEELEYSSDVIQKLDQIIDIMNRQSHGTVQDVTDNAHYISGSDLLTLVNTALSLMQDIDKEHVDRATNISSTVNTPELTPEEKEMLETGTGVLLEENNNHVAVKTPMDQIF